MKLASMDITHIEKWPIEDKIAGFYLEKNQVLLTSTAPLSIAEKRWMRKNRFRKVEKNFCFRDYFHVIYRYNDDYWIRGNLFISNPEGGMTKEYIYRAMVDIYDVSFVSKKCK